MSSVWRVGPVVDWTRGLGGRWSYYQRRDRRLGHLKPQLRGLPFHCHLIKYDPAKAIVNYDDGSWTSFSDVGKVFDGVELTMETYLETEQVHLDAIRTMAMESRASTFRDEYRPARSLTLDHMLEQVRSALRDEDAGWWWNSQDLDFYIIVGWDYHLYVGSHVECVQGVTLALNSGLHPRLDEGPSPYLYE